MKVYFLITGLFLAVALQSCRDSKKLPDLRETYKRNDTRPFGGNVAFRLIEHAYPGLEPEESKWSFYRAYNQKLADSGSMYFCITPQFLVEEDDAQAVLNYVYRGNTFFLSSSNIDTVFLNRIYCEVERKSFFSFAWPGFFHRSSLSLIQSMSSADSFQYYYAPFISYFSVINDNYCRIIGYNEEHEPNCIVFFWGKGKMILHTEPRAFGNYFLLKDNNHRYLLDILQALDRNPRQLVWDTYYQGKRAKSAGGGFSSFSEIFRYPPLTWAFWLILGALALYVLFGGKRRQRIIKQRALNQNSSLAFTETIARLYLQKHDNKNIAEKMITYFNEFIRNHYFLTGQPGTEEFVKNLSRKSGVGLAETESLYRAVSQVSQQDEVSDFELLSLHEQIQQFYKKRQ